MYEPGGAAGANDSERGAGQSDEASDRADGDAQAAEEGRSDGVAGGRGAVAALGATGIALAGRRRGVFAPCGRGNRKGNR
jgi:hypothetical protein